jgi:hypothetical protein
VPSDTPAPGVRHARQAALESLTASAAANIPGVEFASITIRDADGTLHTVAPTEELATRMDELQYELKEGPCFAAVTRERFVLINDMRSTGEERDFARRAAEMGVLAQAGVQLADGNHRAGLNLYSRRAGAFDQSTVQLAELFATQAASILNYADQVEQLSEAVHTRSDIGVALGIVMERYSINSQQALAFLVRNATSRDLKLRALAQQIIDATFESTPEDDEAAHVWP